MLVSSIIVFSGGIVLWVSSMFTPLSMEFPEVYTLVSKISGFLLFLGLVGMITSVYCKG